MSDKFYLQDFAEATIAQKGTPAEIAELKSRLTQQADLEGKHINDFWYRLTKLDLSDSKQRAKIAKFISNERALKGGNAGIDFEAPAAILEKYSILADNATAQAKVEVAVVKEQNGIAPSINDALGAEAQKVVDARIDKETAQKSMELSATVYNKNSKEQFKDRFASARLKLTADTTANKKLLETLDAFLSEGGQVYLKALALQKAIAEVSRGAKFSNDKSRAKGSPDGFVGPITLAALERVVGIVTTPADVPAPVAPSQRIPGGDRSDTLPRAPSPSGGRSQSGQASPTQPAAPSAPRTPGVQSSIESTENFANLAQLYAQFKKVAQQIDTAFWKATPEVRNADRAKLMGEYQKLQSALMSLTPEQKSTQEVQMILRNLAEFFDGGADNTHHKNPMEATNINIALLGGLRYLDKGHSSAFNWPTPPTAQDINNKLAGTKLMEAVNVQVASGVGPETALGYIMSSPKYKGEYQKAYESVTKAYNTALEKKVQEIQMLQAAGKLTPPPTTAQIGALEHLSKIVGLGVFSISSENYNMLGTVGKAAGMVIVGAGLAGWGVANAWNPTGWGALVGASSALTAGLATMTYAGAFARGSDYASKKEIALEAGISVLTLIPGVVLYKLPATAVRAAQLGKGVVALEFGSNVAVGVSADGMRSLFHKTDISWSSSLGQNLLFALAPLAGGYAMRNAATRMKLATRAQDEMAGLAHLQQNGGSPAQVQAAAARVAATADEAGAIRATTPAAEGGSMIGANLPAAERAAGASVPAGTPGATPATAPAAPATAARAPGTPETAPAAPRVAGAAPEATTGSSAASPQVVGVSGAKLGDTFVVKAGEKFKSMADGNTASYGDVLVTRQKTGFVAKKGESGEMSFDNTPTGRTALARYIQDNVSADQVFKSGLSSQALPRLEKMVGKDFQVGESVFKVHKTGKDGYIIQKRTAPGKYEPINDTEFTKLTPIEQAGIIDHMYGKGTSKSIDTFSARSKEHAATVKSKVEGMKVKEFFLENGNAKDFKGVIKIPKYMYDWSFGRMVKELGISLHLPGMQKAEALRTLYTGRSSHGNLLAHNGGAFPTAWTPSLGVFAGVAGFTGFELGLEAYRNNPNGEWFGDMMREESDARTQGIETFLNNYFTYQIFGILGTLYTDTSTILSGAGSGTKGVYSWVKKPFTHAGSNDNKQPAK